MRSCAAVAAAVAIWLTGCRAHESAPRAPTAAAPHPSAPALRVLQGQADPRSLVVTGPEDLAGARELRVLLVPSASEARLDAILAGWEKVDAEEHRKAIEATRGAAVERPGVESVGMEGDGLWVGTQKTDFGTTASSVVCEIRLGNPAEKVAVAGIYVGLRDWLDPEGKALAFHLDPDRFAGEGKLFVRLIAKDGSEVAATAVEVSLD